MDKTDPGKQKIQVFGNQNLLPADPIALTPLLKQLNSIVVSNGKVLHKHKDKFLTEKILNSTIWRVVSQTFYDYFS